MTPIEFIAILGTIGLIASSIALGALAVALFREKGAQP